MWQQKKDLSNIQSKLPGKMLTEKIDLLLEDQHGVNKSAQESGTQENTQNLYFMNRHLPATIYEWKLSVSLIVPMIKKYYHQYKCYHFLF